MHEQRLQSLDAFRGLTIAAMLVVNNPGDWGHVYAPLQHAAWDGWTLTDCIFPFFVFISGISMVLSLQRRALAGADKLQLWGQATRRGLVIMAIGLALNFIPALDPSTLRFPGVLQRLGLCTVLAAPIVLYFAWRAQVAWLLGLLLIYTGLQSWVPVPDAQGVWHAGSWLAGQDTGAWLDRALMDGHLWRTSKTWDPEGLLSTMPAVASQFGRRAGRALAAGAKGAGRKNGVAARHWPSLSVAGPYRRRLEHAHQQSTVEPRLCAPDGRLGLRQFGRFALAAGRHAVGNVAHARCRMGPTGGDLWHERLVFVCLIRPGGQDAGLY